MYDRTRLSVAMELVEGQMGKTVHHRPANFDLGQSSVFGSKHGPLQLASLSIMPSKRLRTINQSYNGPPPSLPEDSIMSSFQKPKAKKSIHDKFNAQCLSPSQRKNEAEFKEFRDDMDDQYRAFQATVRQSPIKHQLKHLDDLGGGEALRFRTSSQVHRQVFSEHSTMVSTKNANLKRTDFLSE